MSMNPQQLKNIIEATLLAAGQPMNMEKLLEVLPEEARPAPQVIQEALQSLSELQPLSEIRSLEAIVAEIDYLLPPVAAWADEEGAEPAQISAATPDAADETAPDVQIHEAADNVVAPTVH